MLNGHSLRYYFKGHQERQQDEAAYLWNGKQVNVTGAQDPAGKREAAEMSLNS